MRKGRSNDWRRHGLSMMQVIVVLSIFATLAALVAPSLARVKLESHALQCKAQLHEIGVAVKQYQKDHHGRLPGSIRRLMPEYIDNPDTLVCPLVRALTPNTVNSLTERARSRGFAWSSYFMFSQIGLDDLERRGVIDAGFGFTQILKRRGSDTPVVVCLDHREPWSLNPYLAVEGTTFGGVDLAQYPKWDFPEAPIMVLRYDGRVDETQKGGTITHHTFVSTEHHLETL